MDILGYLQSEFENKFIQVFSVPWNLFTGNCNWYTPQGGDTLYLKVNTTIPVLDIILHDIFILLFIHILSLFCDSHMIFNNMCSHGNLVQAHAILWKLYPLFVFIPGGISFPHYNMVVIPIQCLNPKEDRR